MCNREEYFDDGFNEITETNTDKMLKAITTISNNQKELEQKLEQRSAPKNEPPEQGPVNIFTPHYPQQVYRQSHRQNFRPQYQTTDQITPNISLIIVEFSKTIGPSNSMSLVPIITESLDRNAPRPFYHNEQSQTRNYWTEPSDSPPFVHPAYVNRPVYRFPTKNTRQNLLRQGIVYDSPAQDRYGMQKAKEFSRAGALQSRNMRGMKYPFNQQKN